MVNKTEGTPLPSWSSWSVETTDSIGTKASVPTVRVACCQGTFSRLEGAGAEGSLIMGIMSLRVRAPWISGGREQAGSKV